MLKTNQNGRSMVEMLGVLAIIGVLSVAGIVGYTIAMRKYKANEIAEAISMLAIAAKTANGGQGITTSENDYSYDDLLEDTHTIAGVETLTVNTASGGGYDIKLDAESEPLCQAVANILGASSSNPIHYKGVCSTTGELNIHAN